MDDLRLTLGARYDHYSDVGGEFSPRLGINWDWAQNYYTKFNCGRSFRAPTFNELYDPWQGNPDLKPVTKDGLELSFGARFLPGFSAEITGFFGKARNNIINVLVNDPPHWKSMNAGQSQGKGVELKMKYDFGRGTYLSMNYTYLDIDVEGAYNQSYVLWNEPMQLGTLSANIRLNRYLNLNACLLYRGDWSRADGDTRDDPGDYATVNATLIAKNFLNELKGLEVRAAVKNLFDKDYTGPTGLNQLPDDLPMPGINFFLELRYTF